MVYFANGRLPGMSGSVEPWKDHYAERDGLLTQRIRCQVTAEALLREAFDERTADLNETTRIFDFVSPADIQRISSVAVRKWLLRDTVPDEILEEAGARNPRDELAIAKTIVRDIYEAETERQNEEILTRQMFPQRGRCNFTADDWEKEPVGREYFTAARALLCQEQRNGGLPHLSYRDILAISKEAVSDLYIIARLPKAPGDSDGPFMRMSARERERHVLDCAQTCASNLNQNRIKDRAYGLTHAVMTSRGYLSGDGFETPA